MTVATSDPVRSPKTLLRSLKVFQGNLLSFNVEAAPDNPMQLFDQWFRAAVQGGAVEPHAMTLATVGSDGGPNLRTLILKDYLADGLYFASSSAGRKGIELQDNPHAALNFYWREFGRQIRVRGTVTMCAVQRSAEDFRARSLEARAEALLDRQSQLLDGWADWEASISTSMARLQSDPTLVSESWALYKLSPNEIEFWQASETRRHERLQYRRTPDGWSRVMLWP